MENWSYNWLKEQGLAADTLLFWSSLINVLILIVICALGYFLVKRIIFNFVHTRVKKSKNKHDDVFMERKAFRPLAFLIPIYIIRYLAPKLFDVNPKMLAVISTLTILFTIVVILVVAIRALKSIGDIASNTKKYENKPIGSYIQMGVIIIYIIGCVLFLSILVGKSPMAIITAFSAGMAIIILVFKDTILGLIASVQLSVNDMVRLGDWISVDGYDADGDLIEINLMSVKVRNWDKTVTNVPTYALISNGFKNWREMQDLGIRRLLNNLLIDVNSIKSVDENFVNALKEKNLLEGNIDDIKWNNSGDYQHEKFGTLTNLGLFRIYIETYLNNHPGVSNSYIVVRHLQQTGEGLPLGIYAFSNDVSWKPLELLKADVFEHLFAVIKDFDLVLFQRPSGNDLIEAGFGKN